MAAVLHLAEFPGLSPGLQLCFYVYVETDARLVSSSNINLTRLLA
jgi:hypothetical protein